MSSSNCNVPLPAYLTFSVPVPRPARNIFDALATFGTKPPKTHWLKDITVRSHRPFSHHNSNRYTPPDSWPSCLCRKDSSIWRSGIGACANAVPVHIKPTTTSIRTFFISLSFNTQPGRHRAVAQYIAYTRYIERIE